VNLEAILFDCLGVPVTHDLIRRDEKINKLCVRGTPGPKTNPPLLEAATGIVKWKNGD